MKALFEHGTDVFGSVESFRRWLDKPAYGLDNQVPFALLHTSGGMDLIQDELIRIEYGDLA
jgi:putative toxin-antitoxin system antitoxin component (TIGR02293 family)